MTSPPTQLLASASSGNGLANDERVLSFGSFWLSLTRLQLFEGSAQVRLGSRAMAILIALVEKPGTLVTKEELVRVAWPDTFVEEVNLRVHLSAIRRALRDSAETPTFIASVSGRGYRFVAPVSHGATATPPAPPRVSRALLPGALVQLIGREQAVAAVAGMVAAHRLVSVVGPNGVGKTALAAAVARELTERFADGAAYLDVADIEDEEHLVAHLHRTLDVSFVSRPSKLVLLDSCDQLIEAAAVAAESLLQSAPGLHILATSSEPLRAADERVYRLAPLALPPDTNLTLAEAEAYAAVGMLIERITAGDESLRFSDRDVDLLVAVSRKLDGLPLAIEMAAARVQVFGLREVSEQLERGIEFLVDGRRTAAARHRTLRGMLERTHETLDSDERAVLRRLAIFAGGFDLADAGAVAACFELTDHGVVSALGGLVAKSQLTTSRDNQLVRYRLPRPVRAYAHQQLGRSTEIGTVAGNHARLVLVRLGDALGEWQARSRADWLERYSELAEEAIAALDWCFSEHGDADLGAELTARATAILLRAGHYGKVRRYAIEALARENLSAGQRLRLLLQLTTLTEDQEGPIQIETRHLHEAERLRRDVGTAGANAETAAVRSAAALRNGRIRTAVGFARRAARQAWLSGDDSLERTARRLEAEARHYGADHGRSARLAQGLIAGPDWTLPAPVTILTSPHKGAMRVLEARRLWLEGKAEQSRQLLFEALNFASEDGPWSLCEAIGLGACPLLLWYGEDDRAVSYIVQLEREAEHAGLPHWQSWAALYRKVMDHISMREGRRSEGAITLQPTSALQAETWVTLTASLRGLSLEPAHARGWCGPEVLRAKALAAIGAGDELQGAELLREARLLARAQGALAWELRVAMSLARLWRRDRREAAAELLADTHDRFTEGHHTSDLLAAKALLRQLS